MAGRGSRAQRLENMGRALQQEGVDTRSGTPEWVRRMGHIEEWSEEREKSKETAQSLPPSSNEKQRVVQRARGARRSVQLAGSLRPSR